MASNKSLLAMAAAAAFATTPIISFADSASDGWYAAIYGGIASVRDNISTAPIPIGATGAVVFNGADYKVGWDVGVNLGYKSGPVRYEGELLYIRANIENIRANTVAQGGVGGDTDALGVMLNIIYSFDDLGSPVQPYLGGGIGYAHLNANITTAGPATPVAPGVLATGLVFNGSDNEFGYQGMAGLNYNIDNNAAITVGYRYFGTTSSNTLGKRFEAHTGNIGLIYRFDRA